MAALTLVGARSEAQTSTLEASADTYLKSGSANQNAGSDALLRIQSSGNNRALVRFDQAVVAAAVGSGSLAAARLELYIQNNSNNWGTDGRTVDALRMTADWTEAGATWNCGIDTIPTNSQANCAAQWAGGSFADEPSDTILHTNGLTGWISFDVTADVQAALAGAPSFGWMVKKTDENQNVQDEYTSRQGTAGQHPRLVLVVESAASDAVPPKLAIVAPAQPYVVNDPTPQIAVQFGDGGSGVDTASLDVQVDGASIRSGCSITATSATCTLSALANGSHVVHASLRDHAANSATADLTFNLLIGPGSHTATFAATGDSYLRQGSANQNQGAASFLEVQESGNNRALVQIDSQALASTLAGTTLTSATLELYVQTNGKNWGTAGRTVEAHRLTAPWQEAAATWNCAADANLANSQPDCSPQWSGGSFAAAPSATVLHTNSLTGWVQYDVTADVAAFLAGTPNDGWLLKKTNEGASGRVDYTSREGTAGQAPRLVVVFTTPVSGDTTPPTVTITAPADGRYVASAAPTVTAAYSDAGSGVDPASVRLLLDGVDRTAEAQASAAGLLFTPNPPLADGAHAVALSVRDRAGNQSQASIHFTTDTVLPLLGLSAPEPASGAPQAVQATYSDDASGIAPGSFVISLDGADLRPACTVTASGASCALPPLPAGTHSAAASVADIAGNVAAVILSLDRDPGPPSVTITSPAAGSLLHTPTVRVTGTAVENGGGSIAQVTVNGAQATLAGANFEADVPLTAGANDLVATATGSDGRQGFASAAVSLDSQPPLLALTAPLPGQVFNQPIAHVAGTASDGYGIAALTLNGIPLPLPLANSQFALDYPLVEGSNDLVVTAVDGAGNASTASVTATLWSLPQVAIRAPADLATIAATTVTVEGTVSDPAAAVTVNGLPATVAGTAFTRDGVPLIEGGNVITATAAAGGRVTTATINVVRDLTPPHITIDAPADGATVFDSDVTVSGLANDVVAGTVNAAQIAVTVNGVPAVVANRSYLLPALPLAVGDNVLTAVATDASGNVAQASITVHRAAAGLAHLAKVSGDHQQAVIGTALAQPLAVALLDAAGVPVAGKTVLFKLSGSNGSLDNGRRSLAATTGLDGRATAHFTLGTRAGAGNQRVEVSATGFQGMVTFTVTALPGAAALLVVDSGDQQEGIAGQTLPRPLIAVVTDSGFNRLEGVAVDLAAIKGAGLFSNGEQRQTAFTDSDGRVIVPFMLGPVEGTANNVVEARIQGLVDSPVASFSASGRTGGDPAATSVSGVVLDNSSRPVQGVTLRILGSPLTTQTDAQGLFRIAGAPVGRVQLVVDGSTANRPGSWPNLEFEMTTIPGRDNTVHMPIYLLPLSLGSGLLVDETHGAVLTLPELPGLELDVAPGSVTFPGGGRSGVVSITLVHNDKVPMVPNFGQQPRLIVTIQPAGARFDPPARFALPNVEGLAPGEVTELYSFDHDLGHFVSIGPATVSDDGSRLVANPGVGVVKAGWHCGGNPAGQGAPNACPPCSVCNGSTCVPACPIGPRDATRLTDSFLVNFDQACNCHDDDCTFDVKCSPSGCQGTDVIVSAIQGPCVAQAGASATFTASANRPDKVKWTSGGNPSSHTGASYTVQLPPGIGQNVTAGCKVSLQKRVDVLNACQNNSYTYGQTTSFPQRGDIFGGTGYTDPLLGKITPCADGNGACVWVVAEQNRGTFVPSQIAGKTNIETGDDQAITDKNCAQVIADLTPFDSCHGPHRTLFWSRPITEAHEQYHYDHVVTELFDPTKTQFLAYLKSICGQCLDKLPNPGAINPKLQSIFQALRGPYETAKECNAYGATNFQYDNLVAAIKRRAAKEGWPPSCQ